ncbi:MAG: glucose-1-phosphate adenylyltransferase [Myxococcota bacterium]|jgi:glucose-1-phosphate adenylyltransferase
MKHNTIALILGGGRGTRLHPLTAVRSKPAVGVAGKYRLIDITVSNCIHSGINKIFVITQFQSTSLHRHLMQTYRFDAFSNGIVEILAAEQTQESESWFQGTADAVRGSLHHALDYNPDTVLILSGDHLYRMDYELMLAQHWANNADITVAVQPVPRVDAPRMGLLRADEDRNVVEFVEKPQDPAILEKFRAPENLLSASDKSSGEERFLASMGIYAFKPQALIEALSDKTIMDFGKEVLPQSVGVRKLQAYPFSGHWEDIGTIRSFFDAHMAMVQPDPPFALYTPKWPIFTRTRSLPPAQIIESQIRNSMVSEGSRIIGAIIEDSVIGLRSKVRKGAKLKRVVMQGADYFDGERVKPGAEDDSPGIDLGVGENSILEDVIIDKNARIGSNVIITSKSGHPDYKGDSYYIRDGIVVIPRDAVIPDGTII